MKTDIVKFCGELLGILILALGLLFSGKLFNVLLSKLYDLFIGRNHI